ncbi:MAG: hypothetical protein WBZ14_15470 [Terriglobales bacterium]
MKSRAMIFPIAAFLLLLVSVGAAQHQQSKNQPPQYTVVDLGTGLGGNGAIGMSINSRGWVGGYANVASNTSAHAVQWRNGWAIDLGTLGGPNSALYGTNSGFAETDNSDPLGQDFCAYGDYLICLPFILKGNSLVALPTLGGNSAVAYLNNDFGKAVGVSTTSTFDPSCLIDGQPQPPFYLYQGYLPAVWENGRVNTVPLLSGDSAGEADGINDLGEIVGYSGDCLNDSIHSWLWRNGKAVNLGSLGGVLGSAAYGINNLGQVTGASDLAGDQTSDTFLWTEDKGMQDLGTLPGDYYSGGYAINDWGQIVGYSCDINNNCRPFLWQNGSMTDLNTLIPPNSNLYLLYASTINDQGEIVGYGYDQTAGNYHAFLAVASRDGEANGTAASAAPVSTAVRLPDNARTALQPRLMRGHLRGPRAPGAFAATH